MKDIETVILELTPYEAAILRHAMIEVDQSWSKVRPKHAIEDIDDALQGAGVRYLLPTEIETGELLI